MRAKEAIAVVGLGYVGLSTAVSLASKGFKVTGVETNTRKAAMLRKGEAPFFEKGVTELLKHTLASGNLMVTTDHSSAVSPTSTVFMTVGTPSAPNGSMDLSQVKSASRAIGVAIRAHGGGNLVVVKSTVIPGTTDNVIRPIIRRSSGGFRGGGVVVNPEFLREGNALADTISPDRIVVGSDSPAHSRRLISLFRSFYGKRMPEVLRTNTVNAEVIKYASNSFLATKISFINEVANLCEKIPGADVAVVAKGMGLDSRIGRSFLNAGLGFGGSCFPKDAKALLSLSKTLKTDLHVLKGAILTNSRQPLVAVRLARKLLGSLREKKIAMLGLAFKPGTDDVRDAVSIAVAREFIRQGSEVRVYDPRANESAMRLLGKTVRYASSVRDCIEGADCCIIVTEWDEFRQLRPTDFRGMRRRIIVDGRRVLDRRAFEGESQFAAVGYGVP